MPCASSLGVGVPGQQRGGGPVGQRRAEAHVVAQRLAGGGLGRSGSAGGEGRSRPRSFSRPALALQGPGRAAFPLKAAPRPGAPSSRSSARSRSSGPVRGGQRPWPNPPTQQKPRRPRSLSGAHPRPHAPPWGPQTQLRRPVRPESPVPGLFDALRASGPRHLTATLGTRGPCWAAEPGPGCTTLYRFLAIQVIHPWSPLGPPISSPIPSPTIKTTSWPRDGGQARAGGCGTGSPAPPPRQPASQTPPSR